MVISGNLVDLLHLFQKGVSKGGNLSPELDLRPRLGALKSAVANGAIYGASKASRPLPSDSNQIRQVRITNQIGNSILNFGVEDSRRRVFWMLANGHEKEHRSPLEILY